MFLVVVSRVFCFCFYFCQQNLNSTRQQQQKPATISLKIHPKKRFIHEFKIHKKNTLETFFFFFFLQQIKRMQCIRVTVIEEVWKDLHILRIAFIENNSNLLILSQWFKHNHFTVVCYNLHLLIIVILQFSFRI